MDGFFDKYGRMIIIAVAICFVLLYLTPMRNVVGSSINGFAGNFTNKVGESLGTVKMPDGSANVVKEKSSMIIGTVGNFIYGPTPDTQFANAIPEAATAVVFTDEVAPEGVSTTDLTVAKDGSVVGWLDGTTWKVSTQNPNKAITFNENCVGMFYAPNGESYECKNKLKLSQISFNNVDTSSVTNMEFMFAGCEELEKLDLSSFDTSKVTDMLYMFADCKNLKELDLSSFDTSKVVEMNGMFVACKNLQELDVRSFDTSNVTDMDAMFSGCSNLTSLDLSSFDTSNVHICEGMFDDCLKLKTVKARSQKDVDFFTSPSLVGPRVDPSVKFEIA